MVLVCADEKVCRAVVRLDAVDVMHDFGLLVAAPKVAKRATDSALCNKDVFVLPLACASADDNVAVTTHGSVADGLC